MGRCLRSPSEVRTERENLRNGSDELYGAALMKEKRQQRRRIQKAGSDLETLAEKVAEKLKDELLAEKIASEIVESSNRDKIYQHINDCVQRLRGNLVDTQEWVRNLLLEVRILQDLLHRKVGISQTDIEAHKREKTLELFLQEKYWNGLNVLITGGNSIKDDGTRLVDCMERLEFCGGACCFIGFPLTSDEIKKGIIEWDDSHPFKIRHDEWDICAHWDSRTKRCRVYEDRPLVCRRYSCENDRRIWLNFEEKIVNPKLKQRLKKKPSVSKPRKKKTKSS
jgi:Fe-S-cluster containining protein